MDKATKNLQWKIHINPCFNLSHFYVNNWIIQKTRKHLVIKDGRIKHRINNYDITFFI